ncbi:MAG: VWA domain-containing protein [Acidobacteria bacterium]|nr:VWA domain-containing protein [Acidobacteriota bacterium]
MTFASPERLAVLILVGIAAVAYLLLQSRRSKYALRFSNVELLESVAPSRPGWRRHVPAATFLVALVFLGVSFAQPQRDEQVPRERATVILALDTSLSMEAADVEPSRIDAAKQAAQSFVDLLPETLNVGLVSFHGTAVVRVPPTQDFLAVKDAIGRLELNEATAIGDAVIASLEAIDTVPVPDGEEEIPAVVVIMSDGESTIGTPIDTAIAEAVDRGVPISTIAFGTPDGEIEIEEEGFIKVPVAEEDLRDIANATDGSFFEAGSVEELNSIYEGLGSAIGHETEQRDISQWFVALALAFALLTSGLSLLWFSRLP